MNSLLYSSLFLCMTLCASFTIDGTRQNRNSNWLPQPNWPSYPRSNPRGPPPPWDIPRPSYPLLAKKPTVATPIPPTSEKPIILYKLECDPCPPGWGVKSLCTNTSATVCRPCPLGMWSPRIHHYRPCMPCSRCGEGLFEEQTCFSTSDTKCDSCTGTKVNVNEDFIRKCTTTSDEVVEFGAMEDSSEVLDMKSKELDGDLGQDFDSNEEDFDRLLILYPENKNNQNKNKNQEKDINIDDPEIDTDQPQTRKPKEKQIDISKEQEEEWARIMVLRSRVSVTDFTEDIEDEIEKESNKLQMEQKIQKSTLAPTSATPSRRLFLHPIRPLPQMMPIPERKIRVDSEDGIVEEEEPPTENNFPPSFNSYPIDSLVHAGEGQRRKAIVLLVLICVIVVATLAFVVCYVKEYCRRRSMLYNRVLVVNLSQEEREIVRQSAHVLERMEQHPIKKQRHGYSPMINAESDASICVTENPLEAYLNHTDDRIIENEGLVDNEVLDPKVHRTNAPIA